MSEAQRIKVGSTVRLSFSQEDRGVGRVIEERRLGENVSFHVHFMETGSDSFHYAEELVVVRSVEERFVAGEFEERTRPFDVRALAEGLQWANASTGELLVSLVDPLPHQILLTHRVISSDPVRRLVADDVGLGKTIEAGMILSALRRRRESLRVLIVVPAGLVPQWIEEMEEKFNIPLHHLTSKSLPRSNRQWQNIGNAIASIDFLKAPRYLDPVRQSGIWDVVVIDEAHRLSKSDQSVAQRYRLAEQLLDGSRCRAAILLTGTPHQGSNEKFFNLLALLDPELRRGRSSGVKVAPDRLNAIMVRNRKLDVTSADGTRIFDPSPDVHTWLIKATQAFREFDRALRQYLRRGFDQERREASSRGRTIGFVMTTYAKLASSSPRAILRALERRRDRVSGYRAASVSTRGPDERFEGEAIEEGGCEAAEKESEFFSGEASDLENLISLAKAWTEEDRKLDEFLSVIRGLLDHNREERVLIFTEYRGTQAYLSETLRTRFPGLSLVEINGSLDLRQKREAVRAFSKSASFLVSTEAGGEGINLHDRCHVLINYDLPWNPMRLRQRIGRLYRYGQKHQVIVVNFRLDGSVDDAILEHLDKKIKQVVRDLAGLEEDREENLLDDVLGHTVAEVPIDDLVMKVYHGKRVEHVKEDLDRHMMKVQKAARAQQLLFGGVTHFRLADYEAIRCRFGPREVQRFVSGAVREVGGEVEENRVLPGVFSIRMPPGFVKERTKVRAEYAAVTCDRKRAQEEPEVEQCLFENPVFDALVDAVRRWQGKGEVVKRHVRIEGAPANGRFFECHFSVLWDARVGGGDPVREFVGVLVDPENRVVTASWASSAIGRESSGQQVQWLASAQDREAALRVAKQYVDERPDCAVTGRNRRPATVIAAGLLSVN